MTSFVHIEYSMQHPGVVRIERTVEALKYVARGVSGSRAIATLLLSAVVSTLLVAANQVEAGAGEQPECRRQALV